MWGSIVTPTSVRCEMCQGVTCDPTPFVLYSHRKFLEGGMARKTTDTVQLKLRFSEALRRRLEREARRQEHSLNGEIINRLEQSFRKSEDADLLGSTLRALFGGATGDLLRAIATAIWLIEMRTGKKWHEDRETALQVNHAIDRIIFWFLRYDVSSLDLPNLPIGQSRAAANAAALETLQRMGLAPSDAEIDRFRNYFDSEMKDEGEGQ